jgi:hypothetical protein
VLSYPPSLRPVSGDKDALTVARLSPVGSYLLYLNATPRQGTENSKNWAAARLAHLHAAETAGLFTDLGTSWLLLDAELLPWSAKAGQLLREQYAAVGARRGRLPRPRTERRQRARRRCRPGRAMDAGAPVLEQARRPLSGSADPAGGARKRHGV